MTYSDYISQLTSYKNIKLTNDTKSYLLKIMTDDTKAFKQLRSYLKRKKSDESDDPSDKLSAYLEQIDYIRSTKGKFLSGSKHFIITTYGLLYIFSNIRSYPPQFLLKYNKNIILQTLVYEFFEEKTIKQCTGRFYSQLTQYIYECCNLSLTTLNDFNNFDNEEEKIQLIDKLKFDLEWLIRRLGFKLTIMYNENNILSIDPKLKDNVKVTLYESETNMKILLARDNNFIELIKSLEKDFNDGYNEFLNLRETDSEK
ncbi:MAG: hypothetical protein ACPKPY_10990 [Nitrososphaeraceae archaeon]